MRDGETYSEWMARVHVAPREPRMQDGSSAHLQCHRCQHKTSAAETKVPEMVWYCSADPDGDLLLDAALGECPEFQAADLAQQTVMDGLYGTLPQLKPRRVRRAVGSSPDGSRRRRARR